MTALCTATLLTARHALRCLSRDLSRADYLFLYIYRFQADFLLHILSALPSTALVSILADAHERPKLPDLLRDFPRASARTWPGSRIMHTKLWILPNSNLAHLGSANVTRYSYTVAHNSTLRIYHPELVQALHARALRDYENSEPVEPSPT